MKRVIFVLLAILSMSACTEPQTDNLVVNIDGWGNDSIFVNINNGEKIDTLIADKGVVRMNIDPNEEYNNIILTRFDDRIYIDGGTRIRFTKSVIAVLLPNEKITIKGELRDDGLYYSNSQFKDFAELYKKTMPYSISADSIDRVIDNETAQNNNDINHLFEERGDQYDKIRNLHIEYVKSNPNSDFAGYLTMQINTIRFMECYNLLSDSVKNGKYKLLLDKRLKQALEYEAYLTAKASGAITVDHPAPDFTLRSIDSKEYSLSDFRGKWVILDFWGSWCAWCIKGVPDMKKFYDEYSSKLEIIGIACNDTDEKWRESVEQHKMNWVNLFDTKNTNSKYAISGYPTKILIDPKGIIKNIQIGESNDYYNNIITIINQ